MIKIRGLSWTLNIRDNLRFIILRLTWHLSTRTFKVLKEFMYVKCDSTQSYHKISELQSLHVSTHEIELQRLISLQLESVWNIDAHIQCKMSTKPANAVLTLGTMLFITVSLSVFIIKSILFTGWRSDRWWIFWCTLMVKCYRLDWQ